MSANSAIDLMFPTPTCPACEGLGPKGRCPKHGRKRSKVAAECPACGSVESCEHGSGTTERP